MRGVKLAPHSEAGHQDATWGGWELSLLSAAQKRVGISCCFQIYQLKNKFQFDIRENNLQVGWSSTGADLWERLWHMRYSELDYMALSNLSYFEVSFNFEVVLALTKGLDQMTLEVPASLDYFMTVPWSCLTWQSTAAQQPKRSCCCVPHPCLADPGPLPCAGLSRLFLWNVTGKSTCQLSHSTCLLLLWFGQLCAADIIIWLPVQQRTKYGGSMPLNSALKLWSFWLTISFKAPDKNSSVWKPAGVYALF